MEKLFTWAASFETTHIAFIVILAAIILYAFLEQFKKRCWQPMLSVVLILSVFIPRFDAGMEMTREEKKKQTNQLLWCSPQH